MARRAAVMPSSTIELLVSTAARPPRSAGRPVVSRYSPRDITASGGNNEARVTMPKPSRVLFSRPAAAETPMPRARTTGTVTGPVVMAPQSQARPMIGLKRGSRAM